MTSLILRFFPDENDKSFAFYRDFLRVCFNEMLWQSLFLLVAWVTLVYVPLSDLMSRVESKFLKSPALYVTVTACMALATILFVSYRTLQLFPNSADEYVYLYQAETLSQGKLAQPAHPLGKSFFHFNHIGQKDGLSVGRFPPGWPLILSIPFVFHVSPAWVNPLLGVITLVVFYCFVKRCFGRKVALWALLSFALSGFFIFNSASFFSHTACLLFTLGFVFCMYLSNETKADYYALLAGAFLGLVMITRYYTAVLLSLPVLALLFHQYGWKSLRPLLFIGAGFTPFFALLFWYNFQITGNGLLPVTSWIDSNETLGFVKGHTLAKASEHLIRRLLLFLYWSSPALLILYGIFLYRKLRDKAERFLYPEDYYMLLLLFGYFFYHHLGGNQYGPRFVYEAYPFVIVFVIRKAFETKKKWPLALFIAGMIVALAKLPYIMTREEHVITERHDLYNQVRDAEISNAVVFISSHTGVIRPMPASDLVRNGMDYEQEVIYAHDKGDQNRLLMAYYPNRSFYKFVRDREDPRGELVKLNDNNQVEDAATTVGGSNLSGN